MKIVVAPDSFKGSLDAVEAAHAIGRGVKKAVPDAEILLFPMADGGEGTVEALVMATGGRKFETTVTGPLGDPVTAYFGCLGDGTTCVIEMAAASGIRLIPQHRLNPLLATTYGTGELIKQALDHGFRKFVVGIGGSATNDGGAGMLQALGLRFFDSQGRSVGWGGSKLKEIHTIKWEKWDERLKDCEFIIANDVTNPLLGPEGASHVYGPQKGATPEMVEVLEENMKHWADLIHQVTGIRTHDLPGAGAGGGIGAAFAAFLPVKFSRGIEIVIEHSDLKQALRGAVLVITGEGRVDHQTTSGKAPLGVAQEARKHNVPVIVLAGGVGEGIDALYSYGVTSVLSMVDGPMSLDKAMEQAAALLEKKAEQVVRTFMAGRNQVLDGRQ